MGAQKTAIEKTGAEGKEDMNMRLAHFFLQGMQHSYIPSCPQYWTHSGTTSEEDPIVCLGAFLSLE
jgi:hypothetical protein